MNSNTTPVKCSLVSCKNIIQRTATELSKREKHFCSRKCRGEDQTAKWDDQSLEYVKENLGKKNLRHIAQDLKVNYEALKSQVQRWRERQQLESAPIVTKKERPVANTDYFSWQQFRNGVIAPDYAQPF